MSRNDGFTLIETLVAFAILALVFVMVIPLFGDTAHKVDHASNARHAVSLAESKLAGVGSGPIRRGEQAGTEGEFGWRVSVTPTGELPSDNPLHLDTFHVVASVAWVEAGRQQSIALETLRLGARP